MMKTVLAGAMVAALVSVGCAGVTAHENARAASHVTFHASRQMDCEEASLTATCVGKYDNGECYQYEVTGCDKALVFQNTTDGTWSSGS